MAAREGLYSPEPRVVREIILVVAAVLVLASVLAVLLSYAP